jgi:hypothetical protein
MSDDYFQSLSQTDFPVNYADSTQRYATQLPLALSWPVLSGSTTPSDLYTDDPTAFLEYPAGVHKTAIAVQQRDRLGGLTLTLISGSTHVYLQVSEYFADPNPAFISAPYTLSGEAGESNIILASYAADTPNNPQDYWISLPQPGTYKVVFPSPIISTALTVTHSGSAPYRFSQMLPRRSVGGFDIDVNAIRAYHVSATLIDTIALQVSDSIVVGPDLIGEKSIDGSKIIDGTISGVLIQNGAVTGNKILAGTISGALIQGGTITGDLIKAKTISGELINVDKLSALSANMGELFVTEKLEVTDGYLTAGIARVDSTGISIGNLNSALPASEALRIYGSGAVGNIVGMAFYNGNYSATNPQITIQADSTNALEIENNAANGITNFNFTPGGNNSINVYNADLNLKRTLPDVIPPGGTSTKPGTVYGYDKDNVLLYQVGSDGVLFSNGSTNTFTVDAQTGNVSASGTLTAGSSITTLGSLSAAGSVAFGNSYNKFTLDGTNGNVAVAGNLYAEASLAAHTAGDFWTGLNVGRVYAGGLESFKFVVDSSGNTTTDGTLTIAGKLTASNLAYITLSRTTTLSITTAGTTITWAAITSAGRKNKFAYSAASTEVVIPNTGYYLVAGTFATVANVSLTMTLTRGTVNYTSIRQDNPLSTGGGYIFNFCEVLYLTANSTLKMVLTPSANTTLNQNDEGFAGPSPFLNIVQLAGI